MFLFKFSKINVIPCIKKNVLEYNFFYKVKLNYSLLFLIMQSIITYQISYNLKLYTGS